MTTAATPPFDIQKIRIRPLQGEGGLRTFRCGTPEIDRWAKDKCAKHHRQNRTRVFCAHEEDGISTLGFYCLAFSSQSENNLADERFKSIYKGAGAPLVYLQYIAVVRSCQRNGLGTLLLVDALRRSLSVAQNVAFYGVGLRAINQDAARLYQKLGFKAKDESEAHPLMILDIWHIADLFKVQL